MSQDAEADLSRLAVIASRSQRGAHVSLEHTEHGFDLPPLAIKLLRESPLHQSSVVAVYRPGLGVLARSAALSGRDDAADAEVLAAGAVEPFGLLARIADDVYFFAKDRQLSITALIDYSGSVAR